ncbi:hypothetical protein H6G64_36515 [Calothrix sp. FACHB-156]|nr:hypothetical protein [Calothrix membranacea FACHB-236]MBD2342413.1 hypothetical protein [Calothrix sp. FACHB-156]
MQFNEIDGKITTVKTEMMAIEKFARSLIALEKSIQIVSLVEVIVYLGYLGLSSYKSNIKPSVPVISPTI